MPLYDFECQACGHKCEEIKPLDSKGPYKCPQCGAKRLSRVFTTPNVAMRTDRGSPSSARFNRGRIRR